jgi:hypothetical protein
MEEHAQELLDLQGQDQPVLQGKVQGQLDQACLALSIALLDHTLKGDLFDSTLSRLPGGPGGGPRAPELPGPV